MEIASNNLLPAEMREWMRQYINDACIWRSPDRKEVLSGKISGTTYTWQFYIRRALNNAKFCKYLGILFWEEFAPIYKYRQFQIAGLEWGSTPILSAITSTSALYGIKCNAISIRAEVKPYGLKNRFEGIIDYNLPVLLVDDLCNSKNTLVRAKEFCAKEGLHFYDVGFAIINKDLFGDHESHDKYIGEHYSLKTIFTLKDFDFILKTYLAKHGSSRMVPFVREHGSK